MRKGQEVLTTSGTYPRSFVTQIFHNDQPSHGGNRKTFEVSEVRVTRSLVLCVCFVDSCLSFRTFRKYSLKSIKWNIIIWCWKCSSLCSTTYVGIMESEYSPVDINIYHVFLINYHYDCSETKLKQNTLKCSPYTSYSCFK
jgi:hypothetical protein